MSALALIVAATLAQAGTLRSDLALRGGGAGRSVVALSAWDKGGSSDWGAGIPSPTIDCAAVGTSASASLQCSGATPSFAGPGQTAAGSPWWYRNDTAVRPSIALNGSTDWWGLGDVADAPSRLVVCADYEMASATYRVLVGKGAFPGAAGQSWTLYMATPGAMVFYVAKAGPVASSISSSLVSSGYAVTCVAYEYATDGTSVMRGNTNGTAWTGITNAVGPIQSVAGQATIGATAVPGSYWDKSVRRVAIWTGADAPTSAAQLAQIVATQWGLAHDKPASTVATHARTDSTLCCPFSDAECYWLGPGAPCIHAPTYQGWASGGAVAGGIEVFGPGANALADSSDLTSGAWTDDAGVSAADTATAGPAGANWYAVTSATARKRHYSTPLAGAAAVTLTSWMRAVSGAASAEMSISYSVNAATCTCGRSDGGACTADRSTISTQCHAEFAVSTAPFRGWITAAPVSTSSAYPALSGGSLTIGGTAWFASPQFVPTAYPVPYRATTGTAYSGSAGTATSLSVPLAAGLTDASAAMRMSFKSADTTYANRFISFGGIPTPLFVYDHTALGMYDSTNLNTRTYASWTAAPQNVLAFWGGTTMWLDSASDMSATTFDGSMIGAASTVYLGSNGSLYHVNGTISRFVQCRRAGGCR